MCKLTRNLDLAAIVVLALLLGVVQVPQTGTQLVKVAMNHRVKNLRTLTINHPTVMKLIRYR